MWNRGEARIFVVKTITQGEKWPWSECQSGWMTSFHSKPPLPCPPCACRDMANTNKATTSGLDLCLSARICPDSLSIFSERSVSPLQCFLNILNIHVAQKVDTILNLGWGESKSFNTQRLGDLAEWDFKLEITCGLIKKR